MPDPFENRLDNPAIRRRKNLIGAFSTPAPKKTPSYNRFARGGVDRQPSVFNRFEDTAKGFGQQTATDFALGLTRPVYKLAESVGAPDEGLLGKEQFLRGQAQLFTGFGSLAPEEEFISRVKKDTKDYSGKELANDLLASYANFLGGAGAGARLGQFATKSAQGALRGMEAMFPRISQAALTSGGRVVTNIPNTGSGIARGYKPYGTAASQSANINRFSDNVEDDLPTIPEGEALPGEKVGDIIRQTADEIPQPKSIQEAINQVNELVPSSRGGRRDIGFREGYEFVIETEDDVRALRKALLGSENPSALEGAYIQPGVTVRIRPGKSGAEVTKQANDVIYGRSVTRIKEKTNIDSGVGKGKNALSLLGIKIDKNKVNFFSEDEAYDLVSTMKGHLNMPDVQIDFIAKPSQRTPKGQEVIRTGVEHWDHTISPTDYGNWVRDSVSNLIETHGSIGAARKTPEWKALQKEAEEMFYVVVDKNNLSPVPGSTNITIGGGARSIGPAMPTPIIETPITRMLMHPMSPYAARLRTVQNKSGEHHFASYDRSSFKVYNDLKIEEAKKRARQRQRNYLQPLVPEM